MSAFRKQAAEGLLQVGTRVRVTRTFREEDLRAFGRLTRDYNPVHTEPRWCKAKGYGGPICHGLLVGSMFCDPGGQWGWLATDMSFRFRRPVYIGDTVTCELTITELDERQKARGECSFTNQRGEVVMTATLAGYLPNSAERELLGRMVAEGDPTNALP
ncbi:MaoC family dehydratase [Planctomycetota bacterium]